MSLSLSQFEKTQTRGISHKRVTLLMVIKKKVSSNLIKRVLKI